VNGGNGLYSFSFRSANRTECDCPAQQGTENNNTVHIENSSETVSVPYYSFDAEKYQDGESQAVRVTVNYWQQQQQNCSVQYYVNQNEFLGVQSQNVLKITFSVCNLPDEEFAKIGNSSLKYEKTFAALFNLPIDKVTASINTSYSCDEDQNEDQNTQRRRRLLQRGNDAEVTVVIVFADADDAKAAQSEACDEASAELEDIDSCQTAVITEDEAEALLTEEAASDNLLASLSAGTVVGIVLGMIGFVLLVFGAAYCHTSYKRQKLRKQAEPTGERHFPVTSGSGTTSTGSPQVEGGQTRKRLLKTGVSMQAVVDKERVPDTPETETANDMDTPNKVEMIGVSMRASKLPVFAEELARSLYGHENTPTPTQTQTQEGGRASDRDMIRIPMSTPIAAISEEHSEQPFSLNNIGPMDDEKKFEPELANVGSTQFQITQSAMTSGSAYHRMDGLMVDAKDDGYAYLVGSDKNYDEMDDDLSGNMSQDFGAVNPAADIEMKSEAELIKEVTEKGHANRIDYDDLIMDKKIGHGQFGDVYKARWNGNVVVVKQLNSVDAEQEDSGDHQHQTQRHESDDSGIAVVYSEADEVEVNQEEVEKRKKARMARQKEMIAEITLASSLPPHSNLVEIFGYTEGPFGVVMSYLPGDSVQKYVYRQYRKPNDIPTIMEILVILRKAASGLKFLHQYGLVHRDVAARNILLGKLSKANRVDSSTEVRISDFGLTRKLANDAAEQQTQSNFGPLKWMAPESIRQKQYSKKSDVYMFAITMWEVFFGMEPYVEDSAIDVAMGVTTSNKRPKIKMDAQKYRFTDMPDGYEQLMKRCWHKEPKQRPPFSVIVEEIMKIEENPVRRVP